MDTAGVGLEPWDASRSSRRPRRSVSALSKRYQTHNATSIHGPVNRHRIWRIFAGQSGICLVIATFILYVIVSYFLNVPYKRDQELECMKKFLKVMEVEIDKAEKSCLTSAMDVRYFQKCSMRSIGTDPAMSVAKLSEPLDLKLRMSSFAKIAEQLGVIRKLIMEQRNSSKKEVTIMSYTYTASYTKTNNSETAS